MIAAPSLAATVSPAAAAAIPWQAVIIGAGPAGSATAIRLARAGWKVLLVERAAMPRPKVCGCCLSVRARDELRGLLTTRSGESLVGEAPLTHVRVMAAGRCVPLPLPAGGVLSREAFDTALVHEAIAAGAAWLPLTDVAAISDDGSLCQPLRLTCRSNTEPMHLSAVFAVIAAGLVDHIRVGHEPARKHVAAGSRVGIGGALPADALALPAGELVMAVGRRGYCGIVRLEDRRIDLAAAIDRHALTDSTPAAAIAALLAEAGTARQGILLDATILATAGLRATPAMTHASPLVTGPTRRIFRVGDAAAYVEPFTGEGMGWALSSSRLLAAALLGAADAATAFESAHARCFRDLHGRCRRIAAALRHPRLVGSAMRVAAAAPWAARRIVPLLVGASSRTGGAR